jgi:hypothetical protein
MWKHKEVLLSVIYHCQYTTSGYHSSELSGINKSLEHKLRRSQTTEQSFISVFGVYFVRTDNNLMSISSRRFTTDWLWVSFVGSGVKCRLRCTVGLERNMEESRGRYSTKAYVTNYEASSWSFNGRYTLSLSRCPREALCFTSVS